MYFEEAYFEGEEREGFYVEPMMKRAWAAQMEVLKQIDDICVRNNIEYFACGGTLLGAIRHGGYIPWDDDIDIEMKRQDYERFFQIAKKELPQGYEVLNVMHHNGCKGTISRVVNSSHTPLAPERMQQFHGFPWITGVDIFPVDYLPVDKTEEEMMLELYRIVYRLAYDWDNGAISEEEKIKRLDEVEAYCNVKFTNDKPYQQQLWMLVDRIGAMYWDTEASAKEAAIIYYMVLDRADVRIPVSCYAATERVPFENITIPIPTGYEQILTAYYGEDYMIPKQFTADHEYPFYKSQQKLVLKAMCEENGIEVNDKIWDLLF